MGCATPDETASSRDAPLHDGSPTWEEQTMTDDTKTWSEEFWYRGKLTRRRLIGYGTAAGALGASMLVPAPWQAAFGQAKPYKIGTLQPLSGARLAVAGLHRIAAADARDDRCRRLRRARRGRRADRLISS